MRNLCGFFLLIHLGAGILAAQVSTGTMNIEVQDPTGAVIPGASLTLTRTATGDIRQGTTNDRGAFRASFLPIGDYTAAAEARGFKRKTITGLQLRVDQDLNLTVTLDPGDVIETVEVTAATPLL